MLRTAQSFVVDPGNALRTGAELRAYLRRWLGTVVAAARDGQGVASPA